LEYVSFARRSYCKPGASDEAACGAHEDAYWRGVEKKDGKKEGLRGVCGADF
jgi:hypothetical protein